MKNLWCFRSNDDSFLEKGYVGLEGKGIDMSGFDDDCFREMFSNLYPERSPRSNGYFMSQFHILVHKAKVGDYVIHPARDGFIYMGEITGNYVYDDSSDGYSHTRSVKWQKRYSKDILNRDSLATFYCGRRCFMVRNINEFVLYYNNNDYSLAKNNHNISDLVDWNFFYRDGLNMARKLSHKYSSVSQYYSPEDVLQETASKIVRNGIKHDSDKSKLSTFIFKIINCVYIDLSRGKLVKHYDGNLDSIDREIIDGESISIVDTLYDDFVLDDEVLGNVMINSLPDNKDSEDFSFKDIASLVFEGYDIKGIAKRYNTSYKKVMSSYNKGMEALSESQWAEGLRL